MKNLTYDSKLLSSFNRVLTTAATVAVTITGAIATAEAGTIRHDRPDSVYQQYGQWFNSVGYLSTYSGYVGSSCSGTLIGSQWVLTAAHCFAEYNESFFANRASFSVGGRSYSVTRAIVTQDWTRTRGNSSYGGDIALVQLNQAVRNVTPSSLYTGRYEVGQIGTYVGFGNTGNGYTGEVYRSSTKRAGDNAIDLVGGWGNRLLYTDFDNPNWPYGNRAGSPYALDWEYTTAHGDSGGGLFINGLLAGIVSGGDRGSVYGELAWNTRVSSWASGILNYIASFSGYSNARRVNPATYGFSSTRLGGYSDNNSGSQSEFEGMPEFEVYEDNFGVKSVPEPLTVFGNLLALGGLSRWRRIASEKKV
ncbi:trypsin-like serine protease [[Phormidium] sp. ETS-05]|uniref:S1 family peptidase n=1 Tax=[Phormidium] sp. ETS-05 TaxID=222819 RepID=UPI0018EED91F|nr:trypsin-like serine protease [[Phormidium] sp. ETS-05]